MNHSLQRRLVALAYGAACHGAFLVAVSLMGYGLFSGMQSGLGRLEGPWAWIVNGALLLQFPIFHSLLLTRRGLRRLAKCAPAELGNTLAPTTYALSAALQIGSTFLFWSPSGVVLWDPTGIARVLHVAAFVASWLFLGKALLDAGLGLQTGWIGWTAAWRGETPRYPAFPQHGLFARCRQPIYLGFALILWTGPVWTPDHLLIAAVWSGYCALGPLHKERRFASKFGADYEAYRRRVPYLLPRITS